MNTLFKIVQNQSERHKEWYAVLDKLKNGKKVDEEYIEFLLNEGIPNSIRGLAWPILSQIDDKADNT